MKLVGAGGQQVAHYLYDASGSVTTGGTAQLVLAQSMSRSFLFLENTSAANLTFEFGAARATCSLSSGGVSSVSVTNGGFGYTYPPSVLFLGGGGPGNSTYLGLNQPNGASPSNVATAVATLSGGSVNAITVNYSGSGYLIAPFVFLINYPNDPYGCAKPAATTGIVLASGGSMVWNGTACPTDAIAVYGGTTSQTFTVKWMD